MNPSTTAMGYKIKIDIGNAELDGDLVIPDDAIGLVIFAHGSGSSRFSPRNNFVAQQLQRKGIATFLLDLLTRKEDESIANRFDIKMLAERLVIATQYLQQEGDACHNMAIGYFGASTGAAAALVAAAAVGPKIFAVVSRGGRPDLAGEYLQRVTAPTLLLVGEHDHEVLELNRKAQSNLPCITQLTIIKGATHLFEEPGTLEEVADLSGQWFSSYLKHDVASNRKRTIGV